MEKARERERELYLLLAKKVTDLDGLVGIGDASIDRKVSIDKSHLVTIPLGNTSDEILNMAKGSANGSRSFPGAKPGINLELLFSGFLFGDQLEIQIQMLEIANKFPPRAFDLDDFGVHLDLHPFGDIHGFR